MSGDPEGSYRTATGSSIGDTSLEKTNLFPFWSGNRPFVDRVVPIDVFGAHAINKDWNYNHIAYYGPQNNLTFLVDPIAPPLGQSSFFCAPILADPGALITGARVFMYPGRSPLLEEYMTFIMGIYRTGPGIWALTEGAPNYDFMDATIGFEKTTGGAAIGAASGSLHAQNLGNQTLPSPHGSQSTWGNGVGFDMKAQFLEDEDRIYATEVKLLDDDGDPVWAEFTLENGGVTEVAPTGGTYREYKITATTDTSKVGYHNFIRAHRPGKPDAKGRDLTNLALPFLGDYLWIYDGTKPGMYPIVEAYTEGGDLKLHVLSTNSIDNEVSTRKLVLTHSDPTPWESFSIIPNLAYIRSYNDISAAGFPSTPTSGNPFPLY